ncbi:hypothetical protein GCM10010124_30320 [Pilimelia terevasa]|uniref:MinD-like ATPase involved in chromosome partitioning or flagellar assembly n=1 Tax=Pilimelia terevasa TaxID=53372 RepID=A0A8J3BU89_9ACTN|nr:ParA family protein [Pilimelia terevasa]GGK35566.1 hypothetical protein GCM10010124_30320 [Pilimelia terevasa]
MPQQPYTPENTTTAHSTQDFWPPDVTRADDEAPSAPAPPPERAAPAPPPGRAAAPAWSTASPWSTPPGSPPRPPDAAAPDAPGPPPTTYGPHPAVHGPQPVAPEPHPAAPEPHPAAAEPHPAAPGPHPAAPRPRPTAPDRAAVPQQRAAANPRRPYIPLLPRRTRTRGTAEVPTAAAPPDRAAARRAAIEPPTEDLLPISYDDPAADPPLLIPAGTRGARHRPAGPQAWDAPDRRSDPPPHDPYAALADLTDAATDAPAPAGTDPYAALAAAEGSPDRQAVPPSHRTAGSPAAGGPPAVPTAAAAEGAAARVPRQQAGPAWAREADLPPEVDARPVPTADDFARRRAARPADPLATSGARAAVRKATLGLVRLGPGERELEHRRYVETVRRNFGGLRQVTVVNPKGGAGKTVAVLLSAMTFGQHRGGYVLAWDNNETQGTLGMRAQQDFHSRTVRDLLRDLDQFAGAQGRVGDLSQYVRAQGEGMFDVLASDESATAGEMLTAQAFAELREVVSRFYKLIFVDTGNNVRAENWQAAIDATDQLVVTMSARNDSAEPAARMLDHLEQTGRRRLVRQAVTVVSMPPTRKDIDLPAIQEHFAARTRAVLLAPYEKLVDSGEPVRYGQLSGASREAWLRIAAAVAEGL